MLITGKYSAWATLVMTSTQTLGDLLTDPMGQGILESGA